MELVSKIVVQRFQLETLEEEEERERTTPRVVFDCGVLTQESADTLPILIRRDDGQSQTRVADMNGKIPYHISACFLSIKESFLKTNELSMKVFRESRRHLMVRETKKQDRNPEGFDFEGTWHRGAMMTETRRAF